MIDILGFIINFFLSLWWIFLPFFLTQIVWEKYLDNKRGDYIKKNFNYVFFEIIFPEVTLKTPKLMEIVFNNLHVSAKKIKRIEEIIQGKVPFSYVLYLWFHDRKIRFVIGTPIDQKELVKSSFYTSYPKLKLKEIENPWKKFNFSVPNSFYETVILSFNLKKPDYIPLKTYELLERLPPEERIDPASAFWELKEDISNKEWLILSFVILPVLGDDEKYGAAWIIRGQAALDYIIGKPPPPPTITLREEIEEFILNLLKAIYKYPEWKKAPEPKPFEFNIQKLTPQQRELLENIQNKIKKFGFLSSVKAVYLAPREIFVQKSGKVIGELRGALNHFSTEDLNGFVPLITHDVPHYELFSNFKIFLLKFINFDRIKKLKDVIPKPYGFVLNSSELATIFHHPFEGYLGIEKTHEETGLPQLPFL